MKTMMLAASVMYLVNAFTPGNADNQLRVIELVSREAAKGIVLREDLNANMDDPAVLDRLEQTQSDIRQIMGNRLNKKGVRLLRLSAGNWSPASKRDESRAFLVLFEGDVAKQLSTRLRELAGKKNASNQTFDFSVYELKIPHLDQAHRRLHAYQFECIGEMGDSVLGQLFYNVEIPISLASAAYGKLDGVKVAVDGSTRLGTPEGPADDQDAEPATKPADQIHSVTLSQVAGNAHQYTVAIYWNYGTRKITYEVQDDVVTTVKTEDSGQAMPEGLPLQVLFP